MDAKAPPVVEGELLALSEEDWAQASLRAQVIGPLAASTVVGREAADAAAEQLGVSRRRVYALVRQCRQGTGLVSDLALGRSRGGQGKGRLSEPVERLIREQVRKRFLTRQKLSLAALYRDIVRACKTQGLPVPSRNAIERRVARLYPRELARKREGEAAARELQSAGRLPPEALAPLDRVQIDHTVIDLMVVDEHDRQPIGRPYLTVAIDDYSRCLLGMV
ncbi:MAG TPA: DNA-binding domain-containing protein, partial [Lamprocystis sp. (in: g-proteobacteria)]|nr:DNA-binding domain-containing protein [Lamprocystis sp. (in: g-proteobacteria)]